MDNESKINKNIKLDINESTDETPTTLTNVIVDSTHMLEIVLNNVPQHIFWKDINSVFLGCNRNFSNSLGLNSPEDIIGKTDFDIYKKERAKKLMETDKQVISTGDPLYEVQELHKNDDGEGIWININKIPMKDNRGKIIGILGTIEDITDKVLLTKKLAKNAKKYKNLIEQTNTAYMILNTKLHIIEANKNFSDLMEMKDYDIIDRSPREWVQNRDIISFDNAFDKILQGHQIDDLELDLVNSNKLCKRVSMSANLIENGGKLIFCLLRDMSKKKMEENRKYIEQQKKKDKLRQDINNIRDKLRNIRAK